MLVFALDLEEVKEICACRTDLDEVFRRMGSWCGEGGDGKVLRSGDVFCYLNSFHAEVGLATVQL